MIKASEICELLRGRYTPPEWGIFFEVSSATGASSKRFADALAVNMYPSRGMSILGFEIKVSRSDLIKELKTPDKAEAIAKYCNEWWLVVPAWFVSENDNIPAAWGIMECDTTNGLRIAKRAQALTPAPITKEFMCSVLRSSGKLDRETVSLIQQDAFKKAQQANEEYIRREIGYLTKKHETLAGQIKILEELTGKNISEWTDIPNLSKNFMLAENVNKLKGELGQLDRIRNTMQAFLRDTEQLIRGDIGNE